MMSVKEPIQVYCRLRPLNDNEKPCIEVISPSTVKVSPPDTAVNYQSGYIKETQHTFSLVFDDTASQKTVFNSVALPLVDGVLHGKNGLLFTYGITGSGKTYTMTGTSKETGIMPRALDVIFNSITHLQAKKYVFKPDRLNGFEVQNEEDAKMDGLNEIQTIHNSKEVLSSRTPRKFQRQESEWFNRSVEEAKVNDVNEDNMYAVFVTYVEIYNNSVFDLLDENFEELSSRGRGPQSKLVREDGAKNMYVHGVTEVEVKSTDDAFEVFNKGLRRRRMAHNNLNAESSRSHSVFTVRVVQAPLDTYGETVLQDKHRISVSQLSFVDLAGSERTSRTKTTGQQLREAGNINNSLMTLRTCLEILRENQVNNTNKLVPYRGSKLTHLFKNFFDGESIVRFIVCVNPKTEDYDENIQVMKFAEMSQEIQVVKSTPLRNIDNLPAGRRMANQTFKRAMANLRETHNENIPIDFGVSTVYSLDSHFPDMCLMGPENDSLLKNLMMFLEVEIAKKKKLEHELEDKGKQFRSLLIQTEEELMMLKHKISLQSSEVETYKEKIANLESKLVKKEVENSSLKKQSSGYERVIKRLQDEIHEKNAAIDKRLQDREREKQRYQSKIAHTTERLNEQLDKKLANQKRKLEMEMENKERKLQQVKRILSDETLHTPTPRSLDTPTTSNYNLWTPSADSKDMPSSVTVRKRVAAYHTSRSQAQSRTPASATHTRTPASVTHTRTPAVSNPRYRRSRSVGEERWLDHRPRAPVPLNTVLQPWLHRRKSVTQLTGPSDLTDKEKYCLLTQQQDSDGDLETCIYKGDVVPTCGGGAQVILNDVEILRQKSPQSSPTRKRNKDCVEENVGEKCTISIEGHPKRYKH